MDFFDWFVLFAACLVFASFVLHYFFVSLFFAWVCLWLSLLFVFLGYFFRYFEVVYYG